MTDIDIRENAIRTAIDAGVALGVPKSIEPGLSYSVVVPSGADHRVVRVPFAHPEYDDAPMRATGTYHPATVEALTEIVQRHHDEKATTIWVHPTQGRVIAIFNDSHPAGPAWRDHRAQLTLTVPPEWRHWTAKDGHLMSQVQFAEHVEDGLDEIADPPAADILELAQTFHAHSSAQFRSAHRLQDGQVRVQYDEKIEATAGTSGEMKIPREITLKIAPFLGEQPYRMTALLRYRVGGGALQLGYKLQRPDAVVRDALDKIAERLREQFPSVFIGEPGV